MYGLEYRTSNTCIAYPFKQGQQIPADVVELFVDACIHAPSYNVALTNARYSITTGEFYFVVDGKEYSLNAYAYGDAAFAEVEDDNSVFVVDLFRLNASAGFEFEGSAIFEESCVFVESDSVESVEIYNGTDGTGTPDAILTGDVLLLCGNNIDSVKSTDSNGIKLVAEPGLGLGKVPCDDTCSEEDENTNGSPLHTDESGNAVLTGDGCYEITQNDSIIQIHGKCAACCQCADFIDIVGKLKDIALRVKRVKDVENEHSKTYFDVVHSFGNLKCKPEFDLQISIQPDARISSEVYSKSRTLNLSGNSYFKVSCNVTNLCGVPALITVPDLWASGEYGKTGMLYISGRIKANGPMTSNPADLLSNGIQVVVSSVPSAPLSFGYTISPTSAASRVNNPLGFVVYSETRGRSTKDNSINPSIGLTSPAGWKDRVDTKSDWDYWSSLAIKDLNAGKNPTETMATGRVGFSSGGSGFEMPAGYSFNITNMYGIPSTKMKKDTVICAIFRAYVYAGSLGYAKAYNWALPTTSSYKNGSDTVIKNTWSLNDSVFAKGYEGADLRVPIWCGIAYYVGTGESKVFKVENGVVKLG